MTYSPQYSDDRRARVGKNSRGAIMFWHPCKICGLVNAPNGFNVSLKRDKLGDWFCAEHIPEQYRKTASNAGDL